MKAPDKIYAMIVAGTLYADTKQHEVFNKPYAEYIRKGVLMEWAKKELETRRNTGDDYFLPAFVVLNDLIDKLNSM